jgi:hypothetical protein
LVLSGKFASAVVFDQASGTPSPHLDVPAQTIYVPSAAGISAGHVGYELPASADLAALASQSATAMQAGHSQSVTLGGNSAGGTLVLNGATVAFVVLCKQYSPPPTVYGVGDGAPHH